MPSRTSARPSSASGFPHKTSSQRLSSRRTTTATVVDIPDEGPMTSLRTRICEVFGDAQKSTAGHRKSATSLRKIQEECCYVLPQVRGREKQAEECGEDDFNVEVARYAALATDSEAEETQTLPETPSTRLTSYILSILLPLLGSKEKVVRYRATQLIAHIINSLDSVDDEYYELIRLSLLKRVRDKEPMIRVQAVLGLGRLAGNEAEEDQDDADSDNEEASGLLRKLLEVLQNDPSADVRRSLLLNLPLTPTTLPFLLERARDIDSAIRRALYSRLLPALGDFRHLSLSMREKLLRWGLRDRDENVRKATARLFRERWIEDCAASSTPTDTTSPAQAVSPSMDDLLELLERIDVVNSAAGNGVATEAMKEFWSGRPDYRDAINFDDNFWERLTPESVFVARSFNDFCKNGEDSRFESMTEEKMPEVTKLAFFLQRYTNDLINCIRYNNAMSEGEGTEDSAEREFIVEQLLHIAKLLDYTDEVGRRKMFSLLRETLAIEELPEEITRLVIEVLRGVCGSEAAGEREFCGIVLEAVAEVHDNIAAEEVMADNEDESFHSAHSELSDSTPTKRNTGGRPNGRGDYNSEIDEDKAIREIMINMKCLHIAQCMLENVEGDLQQNIDLVTMLNNLVVPAVRSHEAPIRERGLLCLGLCCLLDQALADENLSLFLHCFTKGHDSLQVSALHILCDIVTTHPNLITAETVDPAFRKSVYKIFSKGLKAAHAPEVQSAATTALCKLMLTSVVRDEDLLKQLVTLFFDPATKENAAVTQALSYFLPVFCHSKRENMEMMAMAAAGIVHAQVNLADEMDEEEEAVGASVVASMLVDWTDTRNLVIQDAAAASWNEAGEKEVKTVDGDVHLSLANSLLERVLTHSCSKEERKVLLGMLGKLYVTSNSTMKKLRGVSDLVAEAIEGKVASDATSRTAVNKLNLALTKALGEAHTVQPNIEEHGADQTLAGNGNDVEAAMEVEATEGKAVTQGQDTLLEQLLDDDGKDV